MINWAVRRLVFPVSADTFISNLMRNVRVGIIGAGAGVEWEILPVLLGPDLTQPSDEGAWGSRRPSSGGDIRWQAPAQVQVQAICDRDEENARRLSRTYRVAATYSDWKTMLLETPLDALICEHATECDFEELLTCAANSGVRSLWFDEPPVADFELVLHLYSQAEARGIFSWWARPLRHAAAHRAARRMINRGEIGDVTALSLRWNSSLGGKSEMFSASNFAAIDLLLACAQSAPVEVLAREAKGVTTMWIALAGGATATIIFSAADLWNAPLPRLEVVGTQGRSLVCEAGRRLALFAPREAARWIEPPGAASHVSAANVNGVADDLKAFVAATVDTKAPHVVETDGRQASRVLQVLEAAAQSLESGAPAKIEPLCIPAAHQRLFATLDANGTLPQAKPSGSKPEYSPTLKLPLNL